MLDENFTKILVRFGRTEQHAFGHDDCGASAGLEQAEEEREKKQFGLLRLDDLQQILRGVLVIERPGKGRIGEDDAYISPPPLRGH